MVSGDSPCLAPVRLRDTVEPAAATLLAWACALTPLVLAITAHAVWPHLAMHFRWRPWFCHAPAAVAAVAIAIALWTGPVRSRWLRVAALLPAIHVLAAVGVWAAWSARRVDRPVWIDPLFGALDEVGFAALALSAAIWLAMLLRSRRGGVAPWLRWLAPFLLVFVAALGLWIAILCRWWPPDGAAGQWLAVLAPPALAAALWMRPVRELRPRRYWPLAVAVAVAVACRIGAASASQLAYSNLAPLVIAGCVLALAAVAALGVAHFLARRPRGVVLTGRARAAGPGQAIAWIDLVGWVDGLRPVARGFVLETAEGNVPVPSGGAITVDIPDDTASLRPGEAVAVIEDGDQVVVSGWERGPADGPFRRTGAPVIGTRGLAITRPRDARRRHGVLLLLWRPCALTLAVVAISALPAIAGLVAGR